MVEKPLSTTMEDALAIRRAAREHHVQVLVNYETTWYTSNTEAIHEAEAGKLGDLRKVVVHDGHEGPKEIGVGPEWLPWLTDPAQNGAGALFDFGCYGADLMTVLKHGKAPTSVTAVVQTDKPGIYPHVDDDATVILHYPGTQTVLMPSWNWPFARKDMEVYGATGYIITVGPDHLRTRYQHEKEESQKAAPPYPKTSATRSPTSLPCFTERSRRRAISPPRHQPRRHADPRCCAHLGKDRPYRRAQTTPAIAHVHERLRQPNRRRRHRKICG